MPAWSRTAAVATSVSARRRTTQTSSSRPRSNISGASPAAELRGAVGDGGRDPRRGDERGGPGRKSEHDKTREHDAGELRACQRRVEGEVAHGDRHDGEGELGD